jgi:hypothetical protein
MDIKGLNTKEPTHSTPPPVTEDKITPICSTSLSDNPPQIFDSAASFQLENAIHQTASLLLFNNLYTSMNNPTGLTSLTFEKGHNYETLAWDKARIADLPKLQILHQRPNPGVGWRAERAAWRLIVHPLLEVKPANRSMHLFCRFLLLISNLHCLFFSNFMGTNYEFPAWIRT